jgi:ubiquitin carboxyl-terminal hydrolase 14
MQQDAEEFLSALFSTLAQNTDMRHLFEIGFDETLTNTLNEEESSVRTETAFKLVCNIQGAQGSSKATTFVNEGIDLGLIGEVEKYSDLVGQNAIFSKVQRIARLPPLLCIQYMRFFWKETPESRDHAGVKCKIVKSVQFDLFFDPLQHCSESLKQRLLENRQKREQVRDRMRDMRMDDEQEGSDSTTFDNEEVHRAMALSLEEGEDDSGKGKEEEEEENSQALSSSSSQPWDESLPENWCGEYELCGIVTHKGRSADSGHYIGWVKVDDGSWVKFDDNVVSESSEEKVLELRGGGDWHTAYLTFYRAVVKK